MLIGIVKIRESPFFTIPECFSVHSNSKMLETIFFIPPASCMIYVFSDANDVSRILLCFLVVLFSMTSVVEHSEAQLV